MGVNAGVTHVSVIVPTRDRPALLREALALRVAAAPAREGVAGALEAVREDGFLVVQLPYGRCFMNLHSLVAAEP